MLRRLAILALLCWVLPAAAQQLALYLKSGAKMSVREYQVEGERVRYYSLERSQWEEIPLRLVDREKTEAADERNRRRVEALRAESRAERAAERKARTELHYVPIEDGVYHFLDNKATWVQQSEVITSKSAKRGFLKVIAPAPIIAGKTTMTVAGTVSPFVVHEARPIFFIRRLNLSRFGLVKLEQETKKERRIVQVIIIVPQSKEMFEEQEEVEVFRQQLASGVYRVWPIKPLEPGEYAVIDYTPGEADLRVWDFSYQPTAPTPEGAQGDPSS